MHGSKLEASACKRCDGGQCESCKQVLRCFRLAVRRGLVQPRFAEAMKAVGLVVEGERVMEGGLEASEGTERLLMSTARRVQGERKGAA